MGDKIIILIMIITFMYGLVVFFKPSLIFNSNDQDSGLIIPPKQSFLMLIFNIFCLFLIAFSDEFGLDRYRAFPFSVLFYYIFMLHKSNARLYFERTLLRREQSER